MGRKVVLDLEKWVRFHFFCPEAEQAMNEWERILRSTYFRQIRVGIIEKFFHPLS
jgi:hypothetical protein